jgi:hypothetical protein
MAVNHGLNFKALTKQEGPKRSMVCFKNECLFVFFKLPPFKLNLVEKKNPTPCILKPVADEETAGQRCHFWNIPPNVLSLFVFSGL